MPCPLTDFVNYYALLEDMSLRQSLGGFSIYESLSSSPEEQKNLKTKNLGSNVFLQFLMSANKICWKKFFCNLVSIVLRGVWPERSNNWASLLYFLHLRKRKKERRTRRGWTGRLPSLTRSSNKIVKKLESEEFAWKKIPPFFFSGSQKS